MYASTTTYGAAPLGADARIGFDIARRIARLAEGSAPLTVLAIGSGGVRELETVGFTVLSATEAPSDAVAALAGEDAAAGAALHRRAATAGDRRLTVCVGVLQDVDREHLGAALKTLHDLTSTVLLLGIATCPSAVAPRTLLPRATWLALLDASGFDLEPSTETEIGAQRSTPITTAGDVAEVWRLADPFRDMAVGCGHVLVLRKRSRPPDWTDHARTVEHLTDVRLRTLKRGAFGALPGDVRVTFNFGAMQDWSFVRPLLDVLPRAQVRFVIGRTQLADHSLRAIHGYLAGRNIEVVRAETFQGVTWGRPRDEIVVSVIESTGTRTHQRSYLFVQQARLYGCSTFLFQHGIWPRAFAGTVVAFASEHVLAWGAEEARRLTERRHTVNGLEAPWGILQPGQIKLVGSPKFTDMLLDAGPSLDRRFGFEPGRFAETIVVATKNLRGRWGVVDENDRTYLPLFRRMIEDNPTTLFVIRPHPADHADRFAELTMPNVRLFDDTLAILLDVPFSRILGRADALVAPPSTVVLDGAVAGVPVYTYATGQPLEFDGMTVASLAEALPTLRSAAERDRLRAAGVAFKARYAEAVDDTFYARFGDMCRAAHETGGTPDASTALAISIGHHLSANPRSGIERLADVLARSSTTRPLGRSLARMWAAVRSGRRKLRKRLLRPRSHT